MDTIVNILSMLLFLAAVFFPVYQLLTKKLKAPDFVQNVIYFLLISLFFSNASGIVDRPYHLIPFMTAKPVLLKTDSVQSIPDTLTNNMQELLILMSSMIILYTIMRFGFWFEKGVKGSYSDAISGCAAFFLYHFFILAVSLVVISAFGYGQLFLFCNYTSGEIIASVQELISAFRSGGISVLRFLYQIYMVFFLITVAGIFIMRFTKNHKENNKEPSSLETPVQG